MEENRLKGKNILLVENDQLFIMLTKRYLKKWECQMTLAVNGQEAVDFVQEGSFDLILMDFGLPIMTGKEAAKLIKTEQDGKYANIPIIAFSGEMIDPNDILEHFDGSISKSFTPEELHKILIDFIG